MAFPKGTHKARAIGAALGMTGTGKEQVAVLFEMVEDPTQRITWYGYFTDAAFDRTIESLRYLGWQGSDLYDWTKLPDDCTNEVEIVVDDERDNHDNLVRKVRWINSGRGIAVKDVLDDQAARLFSAKMKGRVAALQSKKPAPRPAAVGVSDDGPMQANSDDDIPF